MDDIEEVIYSQGEPYPDELHENIEVWILMTILHLISPAQAGFNLTIKYHC